MSSVLFLRKFFYLGETVGEAVVEGAKGHNVWKTKNGETERVVVCGS